MLTLDQFIQKYNGQYISLLTPGKNCFDAVVAWTDNLGIPHFQGNPSPFPYQYAYEIYASFGSFQAQYFNRIANGLFNAPQAGDIIVWKPNYNGGAGHTGVATGKNTFWTFEAFVQNDPVGSNCHLETYDYNYFSSAGIYGWLHPKVLDMTKEQQMLAIINTPISDTDFRNQVRTIYGV